MNYFETVKEDKPIVLDIAPGAKTDIQTNDKVKVTEKKQIFSFNSYQMWYASDEDNYKRVLLPKSNGNPTNIQIMYLANVAVFKNMFKLEFERRSIEQIAQFAYAPYEIFWWIAVSGLGLFVFLAFVFWKNCFGFNCFMKSNFQDEDKEDDVYVMV